MSKTLAPQTQRSTRLMAITQHSNAQDVVISLLFLALTVFFFHSLGNRNDVVKYERANRQIASIETYRQ